MSTLFAAEDGPETVKNVGPAWGDYSAYVNGHNEERSTDKNQRIKNRMPFTHSHAARPHIHRSYMNASGPYFFLDTTESCEANWAAQGPAWIQNTVDFVYGGILDG